MNRIEYMTKLASLLQDVPVEERQEAMKYYNDYFDEAGEENEEEVASELDSPENVAAKIKAELYGRADNTGEYRETGYTDTRFEKRESPAERGYVPSTEKEKKNSWIKILLIVVAILAGITIAGPVVLGVILVILSVLFSGFVALAALVIAAGSMAIVGFALFVAGLTQIASALPVAFALIGSGMIIFALGMVGAVLLIKLCCIAFPPMFRGIVNICRKPFHRKVVSE